MFGRASDNICPYTVEGMSLFGTRPAETRPTAEADIGNLGMPRLKRSIKTTPEKWNISGAERGIEEVQYQISMTLPSKVFDNKKDRLVRTTIGLSQIPH